MKWCRAKLIQRMGVAVLTRDPLSSEPTAVADAPGSGRPHARIALIPVVLKLGFTAESVH